MSENYHTPEKEAQCEFYLRVGDAIRVKRSALNLTQEDIAFLTNVSRVSINNIESGKQRAPLHFLVSVCHILELDFSKVIPNYSFGLKTLDDLRRLKAKNTFNKICQHESMEHIVATNGKEYYFCPICNYSKRV